MMYSKQREQLTADRLGFISGGGEMGALLRSFNWAAHPLGEPGQWPLSLKTMVGLLLHSSFPMVLLWGEDLIGFYNDPVIPTLGSDSRHPAIGKKATDIWGEMWPFIGPLFEQVLATGKPVGFENQLVPLYRDGRTEEAYWTFSCSPIYNDDGAVNGIFVVCTETTEAVLSTRKLVQREQNLRNMILKAPVAMCILRGKNHVVEIANERMIELWGRPLEELQNKPLFVGLPEVRDQGFEKLLADVFFTGNSFSAEEVPVRLPRNNNVETVYVTFLYEPYREPAGAISGVMVVAVDVTGQVRVRKKLEESEQRVRSLVESAPYPIGMYTGREMRIELANQAIIDVYGKGNDVIGKLYSELLPELASQDLFTQLDKVFTTGRPFNARNQRVDLVVDGKLEDYYFNYSFTPLFDTAGNVYGVLNTGADVTDLVLAKQQVEQSERNFRNMVLQAPVAMCILLGPDHVVDIANEMMIALWGKPVNAVMNKPIFEGLPDAREQGLEALLARVYATGEAITANERPVELFRHGRMETVYQNFVYEPYRDSDGSILGVLAISIDVTSQVLARQKIEEVVAERTGELAAANRYLKQSNAELAQFAYIASHDLQEPVRKVSTYAQLLESRLGNADERVSSFITKIKNSSSRMLTLIRDVLAYSELSKIADGYAEVDLQQVIEDVMTDFELLIEQKQARVYASGLPRLEAVPLHMSQLFGNLLSNALKFSRPGMPPEITITARLMKAPAISGHANEEYSDSYRIEVKDNGIGFHQEYATQIFNIFQRLHNKNEYEGTGIGLAMCQKIVQHHRGEIYARSEPGRGTSFVIVLPARQKRVSPAWS